MDNRYICPKSERIVSKKLIEQLFTGSHSMVAFPVRVVYRVESPSMDRPQILISVPKRHLHHAVDRNRVKRQLREAWRHHRQPLLDALPEGKSLQVAFVWLSDRLYDSREVMVRVEKLIHRMASHLS